MSWHRIGLMIAAFLAAIACTWLVLVLHPELVTDAFEATWGPRGMARLATPHGLAALGLALASLLLLALALRPAREENPAAFFTPEERRRILEAIAAAEAQTSGEIRLHLARRTAGDVRAAAIATFNALAMQTTAERNAVLIYVSVLDHRFCILGDEAVDRAVHQDFWDQIRDEMQSLFARRRFVDGVLTAIHHTGEKLRGHFPVRPDDVNELPDEISTD